MTHILNITQIDAGNIRVKDRRMLILERRTPPVRPGDDLQFYTKDDDGRDFLFLTRPCILALPFQLTPTTTIIGQVPFNLQAIAHFACHMGYRSPPEYLGALLGQQCSFRGQLITW